MPTRSHLIVLTLPLFAACGGEPPTPSEVRARIADDLGHVLRETESATQQGSAAFQTDAAFGLLDRFVTSSDSLKRTPGLGRLMTRAARSAKPADPIGEESEADAIVEELNSKLFTDANHVGDGIYKIPADYACTEETFNDDGTTTEALNAECVEQWDKAELRVRVADDDGALILGLQAGANHDEPFTLALTHTSLALTVDLDETGQAIAALAPVFGETAPNASLHGAITGRLEVLGTASARATLSIDRALDVKFADAGVALDGPDAFRFTSAASNLASVSFDGGAGTGAIAFDVGATTAHVPGDVDFEEPAIDLDLPGISITAELATGQPVKFSKISLGDRTTTLAIDGHIAASIDLNKNDGRSLFATMAFDEATGASTIEVAPKLDFQITVDHAALGDEAPVYDVTRVLLDGALRTAPESDQIEVLSGSFAIETNPAEFGFAASAGQCVFSTLTEDVDTGAFYDTWSVGACQ